MAILLGDVFVKIAADAKQLDGDLDQAKGKVTSWASGLAGSVAKLGGAAVLGGVAALAAAVGGIGVAAFSAASDFDAAQKKMQAQLGLTEAGAEKYGETLKKVFANNFGSSIDDVADSITKVNSALAIAGVDIESEAPEFLQKTTEAAIALRDAFGAEINESTSAVATLMKNFGVTADEAFDLIANGYQRGLDANGDMLDGIGEYSTQIRELGGNAENLFSIMQSGQQGAVLGTDKALDAFKEFNIRIKDGSKLTAQGLELVGLNVEKITNGLSTGDLTGLDVFELVKNGLLAIDDPLKQMQAGVALFGTQFEDLGATAFLAMSTTGIAIEDATGAIDKLNVQYENLPAFFEGLRRQALVAITPLGDALLDIANAAAPALGKAFQALQPVIAAVSASIVGALAGVPAMIEAFIANSNFTWEPEFKQVKLGELFDFVQTGAAGEQETNIKIGEWFSFNKSDITGLAALTLGDFLDLGFGTDEDFINIGDYFTFEVDKEGWTKRLELGDFFSFMSEGEGKKKEINIGKYVNLTYEPESKEFHLDIPGILGLHSDEGGVKSFNLGEYVKVVYKPEQGITRLKVGDFINLDASEISDAVAQLTSIKDAVVAFAAGIIENLPTASQYIADLQANWSVLTEAASGVATSLLNAGLAIQVYIEAVQANLAALPGFESLQTFITNLLGIGTAAETGGTQVESAGLKFSTFGEYVAGVQSNLQLLEDAVNLLITALGTGWDWTTSAIGGYFTSLKEMLTSLDGQLDTLGPGFSTFGGYISGVGTNVALLWVALGLLKDALGKALSKEVDGVVEKFTTLSTALSSGWDWVTSGIGAYFTNLKEMLTSLDAQIDTLGPGFATFGEYVTGVGNNLALLWGALLLVKDALGTAFGEELDGIKTKFSDLNTSLSAGWDWVTSGIGAYFTNLTGMLTSLDAQLDTLPQKFTDFLALLSNFSTDAGEGLSQLSADAGQALSDKAAEIGATFSTASLSIAEFAWDTWLDVLTWPAAIAAFAWDTWLDILAWPTEIGEFAWDTWLDVLTWPAAISAFLWDTWLDILTWPTEIFNFGTWKEWVIGIDFTTWVDVFPGWTSIFQSLGIGAAATAAPAAANNAVTLPGTTSGVDPTSPLGQASQGAANRVPATEKDDGRPTERTGGVSVGTVVVNNNVDAQELLYQMSQRLAYG